jgi:acyl-homoserine lactone synthase
MEIHVIDRDNAFLYEDLLDQNWRWRANIFVDELKWPALRIVEGKERDQFDTSSATYLLAVENGRLLGGIRRLRSTEPTLLSEIFPHLAERGFERAPDVYETTRLYVVPSHREPHPCAVSGYLQRALWQHSLSEGGRAVQFVTWAWLAPTLVRSGLLPRALGLPTPHEETELIAMSSPVSQEVIANLTGFYGLEPAPMLRDGLAGSLLPIAA